MTTRVLFISFNGEMSSGEIKAITGLLLNHYVFLAFGSEMATKENLIPFWKIALSINGCKGQDAVIIHSDLPTCKLFRRETRGKAFLVTDEIPIERYLIELLDRCASDLPANSS